MRAALKRVPLLVTTVRAVRALPGVPTLRRVYADRFARQVFTTIYRENQWEDGESRSGTGSSLRATAILRRELPRVLRELGIRSMLDVPCGDFHWMSHMDLSGIEYIGADIVADVIAENTRLYGRRGRFLMLNAARDPLPTADLVLCRDLMIHLSFAQVARVVGHVKESGATWLAATSFPACAANVDIRTGDCRDINLARAPFHFPEPTVLIDEGPHSGATGKAVGVWRVADLP